MLHHRPYITHVIAPTKTKMVHRKLFVPEGQWPPLIAFVACLGSAWPIRCWKSKRAHAKTQTVISRWGRLLRPLRNTPIRPDAPVNPSITKTTGISSVYQPKSEVIERIFYLQGKEYRSLMT